MSIPACIDDAGRDFDCHGENGVIDTRELPILEAKDLSPEEVLRTAIRMGILEPEMEHQELDRRLACLQNYSQ